MTPDGAQQAPFAPDLSASSPDVGARRVEPDIVGRMTSPPGDGETRLSGWGGDWSHDR